MNSPVQVISQLYPKTPFLVEVPIQEDLEGPFLVTSSKSQIWIEDKFPSGIVRSAVVKAPREFLFRACFQRVFEQAQRSSWGSVHPPTPQGIRAALERLAYYGFSEVDIFFGDGFVQDLLPENSSCFEEVWVPAGWAVLLPRDKSFVGTLFDFGQERNSIVIHNASRGISLVVPESG
jgi:hypothetical protein